MFELMVGFAILSTAVLTIFLLFPSSDRAAVRALRINQANELARKLLEETTAQHYSLLQPGVTQGALASERLKRNGAELDTEFAYTMEVRQDAGAPVKEVQVEVYWLEGVAKQRHSVVLESAKGEFW